MVSLENGDVVICINSNPKTLGYNSYLTKGKTYVVIKVYVFNGKIHSIDLIDDRDCKTVYHIGRFIKLEEYREDIINEILE